jgi:hypothetical protein
MTHVKINFFTDDPTQIQTSIGVDTLRLIVEKVELQVITVTDPARTKRLIGELLITDLLKVTDL